MTQYRLLSYRKWLSIRYWVRYLNIWNVVANNSEQGIYVASANIFHHRTGGNVPWWPGCTPAEFLPYDSVFNTESLQIAQYRILSHKRYWVIILQYQHIVQWVLCIFHGLWSSGPLISLRVIPHVGAIHPWAWRFRAQPSRAPTKSFAFRMLWLLSLKGFQPPLLLPPIQCFLLCAQLPRGERATIKMRKYAAAIQVLYPV